ncbi:hypothetical protein QQS21_012245 [Conoideocrella luteorostrata]|uniref:Uncharacterized protein n=1 Tax=Conoideocrella luteorostrata TaxID=1105319 RepID=A0AAJ0CCM4_9HYPO|nr:hypothetical protein QQS21_012245 [Conoideocrella luteorostrata]
MKTFAIVALSVLAAGVQATSSASTVVCEACKPASSTPDIVTRSPVPTTPCTVPALITVPATGGTGPAPTGGSNATATGVPPPTAGANSNGMVVGASGLIALAMGIVVMV